MTGRIHLSLTTTSRGQWCSEISNNNTRKNRNRRYTNKVLRQILFRPTLWSVIKVLITLLKAYSIYTILRPSNLRIWKLLIKKCLRINTSKDVILQSVKNTTRLVNHLRGRARGESFSIFYDPFTAWIHEVENYRFRWTTKWGGNLPTARKLD